MRYSRGIDRCDEEALRGVYWPGATDDHGGFNGDAGEFCTWVLPLLRSRMDQTMHMLGNILIAFRDRDSANVETYFLAYHRLLREDAAPYDLILSGRYLDRMEQRDGEWRIARRRVAYDWAREYPDSIDWSRPVMDVRLRPHRKEDDLERADPLYRLLAE
jgi:hypothetical protein